MTTILEELFKHNLWANLRVLDLCAGLKPDQLDARALGTYGSVRDTLVHIVGAEENYLGLLTGAYPENRLRWNAPFPGIADLRERVRRTGEGLIAVAALVEADQVLRGSWEGKSYAMSVAVPLLQAINHATEHRAHVITILSQNGVVCPEIDGWAFAEESGLITHGDQ